MPAIRIKETGTCLPARAGYHALLDNHLNAEDDFVQARRPIKAFAYTVDAVELIQRHQIGAVLDHLLHFGPNLISLLFIHDTGSLLEQRAKLGIVVHRKTLAAAEHDTQSLRVFGIGAAQTADVQRLNCLGSQQLALGQRLGGNNIDFKRPSVV